uniref:MSP domain-containing protein n=1 Tax=Gossypium raimondii TaxID=29730 RepID=A0A0D2SY82_GOSRA|nr:hypothetical protein B456_008G113000 [Gossypium raimondii]
MSMGDLISIHPSELKFPFELRRQSSCSMQLTNKTEKYVAFKVKTTNPKKYCVRPNSGIVLPGSSCNVTVTMQAQKEAPPEPCRDKFLVQSVVTPDGTTSKDITPEMFNKEDGRVVNEFKMRVIYIPANPPSPVPEGSEEGTPPRASSQENANQNFEEVSFFLFCWLTRKCCLCFSPFINYYWRSYYSLVIYFVFHLFPNLMQNLGIKIFRGY